jgi:hypothetical protein
LNFAKVQLRKAILIGYVVLNIESNLSLPWLSVEFEKKCDLLNYRESKDDFD